jgi:DNA-binding NarL/FixJ family response regulator
LEALANFGLATMRPHHVERLSHQVYDQGTLHTQPDLAVLSPVCDALVSQYVREIQYEGHLLPASGNIQDPFGDITHKREIITLYLQGYLTPDIALKANHSMENVDLYISERMFK